MTRTRGSRVSMLTGMIPCARVLYRRGSCRLFACASTSMHHVSAVRSVVVQEPVQATHRMRAHVELDAGFRLIFQPVQEFLDLLVGNRVVDCEVPPDPRESRVDESWRRHQPAHRVARRSASMMKSSRRLETVWMSTSSRPRAVMTGIHGVRSAGLARAAARSQ